MGILTATRQAACAVEPMDVCVDDPYWTSDDVDELWRMLDGQDPPVRPGLDEDRWTIPVTRGAQLAQLRSLAAEQARCAAREVALLVAVTGRTPRSREVAITDPDDGTTRAFGIVDEVLEEVSVTLRRSLGTVRRQVATARQLATMPQTSAALANASISAAHAEAIARIADGLPVHLVPAFERRVVAKAEVGTVGETTSFARRLRARLDAEGEEARRRSAARHIDVRVWAEDDGLACLQARLPIADAARVHAALENRAREVAFEPEHSMGQRRVMALIEAVCGPPVPPGGMVDDRTSRPAVSVNVTVDLATLLMLSDDPASIDLPGEGPVPITADALRALLADPAVPMSLRRLVADPLTGQLLDRGRTAYRFSGALRDFVVSRDRTCRFPHCNRPAERCDIDHITSWREGGRTDRSNHIPLCRRHHVLKTHGDWVVIRRRDDGAVEWRAPDGSVVVSHPWRPTRDPILQRWDP